MDAGSSAFDQLQPYDSDVPFDYFSSNPAGGKRQKVEVQNGLRVITDGHLLAGDDDDNEGAQPQSSGGDYEDHERYMLQQRGQESLQRGVRAADLIRDAESRKLPMARGQRKIYSIIKTKNYTNDDLVNKLELDDEGLAFASVLPPWESEIYKVLGPELDREECYGCSRGVGVARMDKTEILALRDVILDLYGTCHPLKYVALVYLYFRDKIMDPCNQKLRKGEALIQPWNPRSIWDHVTKHTSEPSFVLGNLLDFWRNHMRQIQASEVYKVSAEVARSGRALEPQDIRVRKRGHDMMKDCTDMILKIQVQNPEKMMFHNPAFNAVKANPGIIAPKENVYETTKLKSVWDNKEL